jgi:hypothetical protein
VDGVTLIVGTGETVTEPVALRELSAMLVAVTATVVVEVKVDGEV